MDATDTPFGSILDVPGVGVGHHQRTGKGWQTGTTVVTVRAGATPGVDVRGGGPGTRETDALRPGNLIRTIHAVTLTGGSAFGLAAADGVMLALEDAGLGFAVGAGVVPVVPAAVIFDLGRGGRFAHRPDASFGERAAKVALTGRRVPSWGAVGAGTGAVAGGLQGGVGTASTTVRLDDVDVVVGAVAVVNSVGSVIDGATGLPWTQPGLRMKRPSPVRRRAIVEAMQARARGLNTTIGVIAVSARLDKAEASKLASVAHDGLARAIRPAHGMTDGDTIFTLAIDDVALPDEPAAHLGALDLLLQAGADTFAAACTHAVLASRTLGTAPSWSDLARG